MSRVPILFFAEAVTTAQVVRLLVLARALDPDRYDVHFASAAFDEAVFAGTTFRRWPVTSLFPSVVDRAVSRGSRIYDEKTLARYLAEDRRLLDAVKPRLVVGDLRWSLSVAAPLGGVPQASLINAYWSPHAVREGWPLPDHPIVRLLGEKTAAKYFPIALPKAFEHFARPVNALRRKHGLAPIGSLPQVMTHGDHTLFADTPALVPVAGDSPAHHRYLGPILWSPAVPLPAWWDRLDPRRPTVYVTLGSSGRAERLPLVVQALSAAGVQAIVATAGRCRIDAPPPHIYVTDFIPGHLAARRAQLVISNGGSTTSYQALAEGRPVVGIAFNLDQYLAMTAVTLAGAGVLLRSGSLTAARLTAAVTAVLATPSYAAAAEGVARDFGAWDAPARFRQFVAEAAG